MSEATILCLRVEPIGSMMPPTFSAPVDCDNLNISCRYVSLIRDLASNRIITLPDEPLNILFNAFVLDSPAQCK